MEFRQRYTWSASVAFHTLLSLAPLLVITVSIAGLVYGKKDAQGELQFDLRNLVGPDVAPAMQMLLTSPRKPLSGFIAVLFGTVTLIDRQEPYASISRLQHCHQWRLRQCQGIRATTINDVNTNMIKKRWAR